MKNILSIVLVLILSAGILVTAQDKKKDSKAPKKEDKKEALLRTGEIDLKKIDKNKDGKVFECPMDWNVLDDAAGRCTECKMKLKEYSIADAAKNLEKHGHKVKK